MENLTNDTPPKRGFGPPLVRYVFHPPQVSVFCFSCTKFHDRADQKVFWRGPKIFGRARSLVRFPPPICFAPPPYHGPTFGAAKVGRPWLGSVRLQFAHGTVRVVPVVGSDGSSGFRFLKKMVPGVPIAVPGKSVSRRGGATKGGGGVSKCEQTQTNEDKRKQTQRRKRKQTRASVDKRKQTLTPPLSCVFLHPPLAISLENSSDGFRFRFGYWSFLRRSYFQRRFDASKWSHKRSLLSKAINSHEPQATWIGVQSEPGTKRIQGHAISQ